MGSHQPAKIPRPARPSGMKVAMQLMDDPSTFSGFTKFLRSLIKKLLIPGELYHQQTQQRLKQITVETMAAFPILQDRYEDDWPVGVYVERFLRDRRNNPRVPRKHSVIPLNGAVKRKTGPPNRTMNTACPSRIAGVGTSNCPVTEAASHKAAELAAANTQKVCDKSFAHQGDKSQEAQDAQNRALLFRRYLQRIDVNIGAMYNFFVHAGLDSQQKLRQVMQWDEATRFAFLRLDVGLSSFQYRLLTHKVRQLLAEDAASERVL